MRIRKRFLVSAKSLSDINPKQQQAAGNLSETPDHEEGREEGEKTSHDHISKEQVLAAEVGIENLPTNGSSHPDKVGEKYERNKVIPSKNKNGSIRRGGDDEDGGINKELETKPKMKLNTGKIYLQKHEQGEHENEGYKNEAKRGNVIVEGSRCSRANGRGWRCCQQTLVGYSLCEHHLGRGKRLRIRMKNNKDKFAILSDTSSSRLGQSERDEEKKPLVNMKKRVKFNGMVKAKSIRSLLGKTDSVVLLDGGDENI